MSSTIATSPIAERWTTGKDNQILADLMLFSHNEPAVTNVSLHSWLEKELLISERWRGGDRRRAIWLSTLQADTLAAAREVFGQHGVEVLRVPPWIDVATDSSSLFSVRHKGLSVLAVLAEGAALNGAPYLRVRRPRDNEMKVIRDSSTSSSQTGDVSPIEMTLSRYACDLLRYPASGGPDSSAIRGDRAVDFGIDPESLLLGHPKVRTAMESNKAFLNILTTALNEGIFFICPENRRQKHVYYSGLHSGVPLPVKVTVDELPRVVLHDLIHELMPDPIIENDVETALERRVYLAHRAVGEVVAVSIADLWFSDLLCEEDQSRDDSAAQLYRHLNLSLDAGPDQLLNLKRLIKANIDLLLKGKSRAFEDILEDSPDARTALASYRQEMAKLLTGDLHWAADNVAGKIVGGSSGQNWGAYAAEMLRQHGLARETLSEAAMRLGYSKLSNWDEAVDTVFEDLFLHRLAPVISAEQIDRESSSICTSKAVVRWIAGQASLFFRFPHLPETEIAHERIAGIIGGVEAEISAEDIATTRQVFITTWNSCGQTVILTSMMR